MDYINNNSMQSAMPVAGAAPTGALDGEMDENQLKAMLANMSDEELDEYLSLMTQDYEGENVIMDEQMASANALRDMATPEGRTAGGMYHAANPLEHLATGLGRGMGSLQERDVNKGRRELGDDKSEALKLMMRGISGR